LAVIRPTVKRSNHLLMVAALAVRGRRVERMHWIFLALFSELREDAFPI
jgi:hypothetical protein